MANAFFPLPGHPGMLPYLPPNMPPEPHSSSRSHGSSSSSSHRHSSSRSRDRSPKRSRSRSPRDRSSSTHHERPKSGAGSLSASKNRAACTIFVSKLHPKIDDMDLFEFFSNVGRVEDIQLIKDSRTGKSKGLAYVEFSNEVDALKSQVLNGQLIGGYPITIALTPASQAAVANTSSSSSSTKKSSTQAPPSGLRIYVGSLNFNIHENDLRPIFEAFGPVVSIDIHRDSGTGLSKGFGFISFLKREDGETAMAALDGYEIAGRPMKVGYASPTDQNKNTNLKQTTPTNLNNIIQMQQQQQQMQQQPIVPQITPTAAPVVPELPPLTPAQLVPSRCILIKNMFNPAEETEPEWFIDLEEDVRDEVEKFGRLDHILVDKESPIGIVWMRFKDVAGAQQAQKALHGRWFASRQLTAEFVAEPAYAAQFP